MSASTQQHVPVSHRGGEPVILGPDAVNIPIAQSPGDLGETGNVVESVSTTFGPGRVILTAENDNVEFVLGGFLPLHAKRKRGACDSY